MPSKTIVFIDDDPGSKVVARRASGRLDCELLFFERASNVFDSIGTIDPKLVVLDMAMVNLDGVYGHQAGLEISAALRERYGDRFPILILTGMENPTLICQCLRQGADDYFVKSVELTGLVKRMAAWLVVDYSAGNPKLEREAVANALEALVDKQGDLEAEEWRRITRSKLSGDQAGASGINRSSRPLGDLFAWQSATARS